MQRGQSQSSWILWPPESPSTTVLKKKERKDEGTGSVGFYGLQSLHKLLSHKKIKKKKRKK